jgi:hypothetical protein
MLLTFAPKRFGAKPDCGTGSLRSAKTSLTAQLKNWHYNRGLESVKIEIRKSAIYCLLRPIFVTKK